MCERLYRKLYETLFSVAHYFRRKCYDSLSPEYCSECGVECGFGHEDDCYRRHRIY